MLHLLGGADLLPESRCEELRAIFDGDEDDGKPLEVAPPPTHRMRHACELVCVAPKHLMNRYPATARETASLPRRLTRDV